MARLNLDVLVKVLGSKELDGLGGKLQKTGSTLSKYVTLPLLGAGVAAFKFASDADEATSKAERVFGSAFKSIGTAAENMDDAFSEAQFLDAAGTFGQMSQAMGATADESAELSKQWLSMAQDFSSFNNIPIEESLTAIRAAISGEYEPLKRLGIIINQATLEAKALELGLWDGEEALDAHAKMLTTNALILEQGGAALGDYAATAEGAANRTKNLTANAQDLGAEFGETLLPVGIQILSMVQGLVGVFAALPEPMQTGIVMVAGFAAALGPLILIGGKLVGLFGLLHTVFLNIPTALGYMDLALAKAGAAFRALSALVMANPYLALAAAVIAIAALIIANWDKILNFLKGVWNAIMGAVRTFANMFEGAWKGISLIVSNIWNGIVGVIKGAINAVIGAINGFIGFINGIQIHIPAIEVGPIKTPAFDWWGLNLGTIPYLAEGGIVTRQTLAMLGEQGAEAVIPLDRFPLGETHFHSHIEVTGQEPFIRNEDDLIRTQQRIAFLEGF